MTSWVSKKAGRQGGEACVRETRIPVWVLEGYRRLGSSERDILLAYPSLTPEDLRVAWVYVGQNKEEIDRVIRENEEIEEDHME